MKTKFKFLVAALLLGTAAASAQTGKPDMLIGTWKVESLKAEFPAKFTAKEKAKGQKTIQDDEAEFKKAGFKFSKDMLLIGDKKFNWVMNSEGTAVTVTKKKKVVVTATIVLLDAHHLVFTRPDEGMIVTYTLDK